MTLRRLALGALTSLLWVGSGAAQLPNDYGDAASWLLPPWPPGCLHRRPDDDGHCGRRADDSRDVGRRSQCANRLLLRCIRPCPRQTRRRRATWSQIQLNESVVRTQFARFCFGLQTVRATLPAGDAGRSARRHGRRQQRGRFNDARCWLQRHSRRVEPITSSTTTRGRGVVLIGHSQGSFVLMELIRNEIDGKPVQSRLLAAILAGTVLPVPKGGDVGGGFQHHCPCAARTRRSVA